MKSRQRQHARDQTPSAFAAALDEFCGLSGARCAALVDAEGETVDYGGRGDPYYIRVLAAEWRLVFQHLKMGPAMSSCTDFIVRAARKSYCLEALPEGYALVAELPRRATSVSERALSHTCSQLCHEAGFGEPSSLRPVWRAVDVLEDDGPRHRPLSIKLEGSWVAVEVLGRLADPGLRRRDLGFRVHLTNRLERNLVREPMGHWFIENEPFG